MKSAAYLYSLMGNDAVVRRDLPSSSPVPSLARATDDQELRALDLRARRSAVNFNALESLRAPQPQQPRLVSSAEGAITEMLLTIPLGNTADDFAAIYNKLMETLPAETRLTCLVNTGAKPEVEAWIEAHGRAATATVVEAPDHVGFSIWAQDAYAVSTADGGETFFIEPLSFLRYADAVIADYVTNATSRRNFQTPLYFQGGNILVGDDFWLIGADYPTKTLEYVQHAIFPAPGESPEQLVRRLYSEYLDSGRQLHYVRSGVPVPAEDVLLTRENGTYFVDIVFQANHPGTVQPLFHIDMFTSLAGRGPEGKYRVLVGDPSLAPAPPSESYAAYAMQEVYDSVAAGLDAAGFEVIRNPLPLTFSQRTVEVSELNRPNDETLYAIYLELTRAGVEEVSLRSWYFATANNALVQNDPAARRVWLPTYGHGAEYAYLAESDEANRQLWETLGYEVTLLPSFHRLARGLGAVHCIQKYMGRSA